MDLFEKLKQNRGPLGQHAKDDMVTLPSQNLKVRFQVK